MREGCSTGPRTGSGTAEYLAPAFLLAAEVACAEGDRDTMLVHLDAFTASTASQPAFRTGFLPLAVRLLARAGERDRAAALLDVEIAEGGTSRRLRLSYDAGRAVFERWGDPAAALAMHTEVGKAWRGCGFPLEVALCHVGAARCLVRMGRIDEARGLLAQARPTFQALGALPYLDDLEAAGALGVRLTHMRPAATMRIEELPGGIPLRLGEDPVRRPLLGDPPLLEERHPGSRRRGRSPSHGSRSPSSCRRRQAPGSRPGPRPRARGRARWSPRRGA